MKDWIKNLFDYNFSKHTEESAKYFIDSITGNEYNIADMVISLSNKIEGLEEKYKGLLLDVKRLEEENIELTNALYESENRLESKIDNIHPTVYNICEDKTLNNFTLGDA
jgi:predicted  nucleic acid-binding Zn-ribbon protein